MTPADREGGAIVSLPRPGRIDLTADEEQLLGRITFDELRDENAWDMRGQSRAAAAELMGSLVTRDAVPRIRLDYFTEPELNVGGHGRSRMQVFQGRGVRGDAIFEHGHFLPHLRYFVFGPDLPAAVIDEFWQRVVEEDPFTSGDLPPLWELVRTAVRKFKLDPTTAREEFYKLALECGLTGSDAVSVRSAVKG